MTDKELLELAAKAAGLDGEYRWDGYGGGSFVALDVTRFSPLTDDGDALRLAVALRINVSACDEGGYAEVDTDTGVVSVFEPIGRDLCAATRRAIVRVAAEIMKENDATLLHSPSCLTALDTIPRLSSQPLPSTTNQKESKNGTPT